MIYFTAHTFKCVCHCRRAMFRVLGMYNFEGRLKLKLSAIVIFQTSVDPCILPSFLESWAKDGSSERQGSKYLPFFLQSCCFQEKALDLLPGILDCQQGRRSQGPKFGQNNRKIFSFKCTHNSLQLSEDKGSVQSITLV